MVITREMVINDLANSVGYYKKDIKTLLLALDDLVEEYLGRVTDDECMNIQLVRGCKVCSKIVGERERRDPRNNEPIVCSPVIKLQAKFSETLKENLQDLYDIRTKNET